MMFGRGMWNKVLEKDKKIHTNIFIVWRNEYCASHRKHQIHVIHFKYTKKVLLYNLLHRRVGIIDIYSVIIYWIFGTRQRYKKSKCPAIKIMSLNFRKSFLTFFFLVSRLHYDIIIFYSTNSISQIWSVKKPKLL